MASPTADGPGNEPFAQVSWGTGLDLAANEGQMHRPRERAPNAMNASPLARFLGECSEDRVIVPVPPAGGPGLARMSTAKLHAK